jgi:type VI secretion system secreted protein Hcp
MPDHSTTRRTLLAGSLTGTALGGLTLAAGPANAEVTVPSDPGVQFFLSVPGIPGESTDAEFPKTFDVLDWSCGAHTSIGPTNTTSPRTKVQASDFNIVKRIDSASPKLFKACCTGQHFKNVTLHCRKASAKQPYLQVELQNVYVSSYQQGVDSVSALPSEVVTFDYGAIVWTFTPQLDTGGFGTPIKAGFNYLKNAVI